MRSLQVLDMQQKRSTTQHTPDPSCIVATRNALWVRHKCAKALVLLLAPLTLHEAFIRLEMFPPTGLQLLLSTLLLLSLADVSTRCSL